MADAGEGKFGAWVLEEVLGQGGNATVWRATRTGDASPLALKVINETKVERESYRRFVREVTFLRDQGTGPGVLPILDAYLPDSPSKRDRAWLAMPIATPISIALAERPLSEVVQAVAVLASTLTRLHGEKIAHRDIKPGNLYELDGEFVIGDFGLVAIDSDHEHRHVCGPCISGGQDCGLGVPATRPGVVDQQDVGSLEHGWHPEVLRVDRARVRGRRRTSEVALESRSGLSHQLAQRVLAFLRRHGRDHRPVGDAVAHQRRGAATMQAEAKDGRQGNDVAVLRDRSRLRLVAAHDVPGLLVREDVGQRGDLVSSLARFVQLLLARDAALVARARCRADRARDAVGADGVAKIAAGGPDKHAAKLLQDSLADSHRPIRPRARREVGPAWRPALW